MRHLRQRDGKHRAARAEVQRVARMLAPHHFRQNLEAACRRAVMAGAEGEPGLDLDGDVADAPLVAVMRAVDQETAGAHGLQAFERLGHPVDVGNGFDAECPHRGAVRNQCGQALGDAVLGLVDIGGNLEDCRLLVDFEDGKRPGLVLERGLEDREGAFRLCLRGAQMIAKLGHGQDPAASRFSLAIAVWAFSP